MSPMRPFFFGTSAKPLFAVHHPPAAAPRGCAVVLCQPFGSESLRSHRALRETAQRLARAGFHALRFDYYGCGDSGGDFEEVDVEQWVADVGDAVEEAKAVSARETVALLGLRLGAALALRASAARPDVRHLVQWEPVVRGQAHLEELALRHERFVAASGADRGGSPPAELLGFPVSARMRLSLEALDVAGDAPARATDLLILQSGVDAGLETMASGFRARGGVVAREAAPSPPFWMESGAFSQPLVPHEAIERLVVWLQQACHD